MMFLSCKGMKNLIKFADCLGLKDEVHSAAFAGKTESRYLVAAEFSNQTKTTQPDTDKERYCA
jgi:hypothetical protein